MNLPRFSVIIPTYHRPELLALCLDCLAPRVQTLDPCSFEIIVSDDSRDDATKLMVQERFPWARWHQGPQRGPAANRNAGAEKAVGEWLVFTDDDCLPQPEWLSSYASAIGKADVLEGLTKAERQQRTFAEESPINLTGGFLWSCNFAIKKSIFNHLDGFDEKFPAPAMEDCDLRERLRKNETFSFFVSEAEVIHPWRPVRSGDFKDTHSKSLFYFYKKHPEKAPRNLVVHFLNNGIRVIKNQILKNSIRYRFRGINHVVGNCIWNFRMAIYYAINRD